MTQPWQQLRQLGEGISDALIGMLQSLDAEVQAGGIPTPVGHDEGDVLTLDAELAPGWAPASGGSQPEGAFSSAGVLFTETAGAGTYTASVQLPANSVLLDVIVYPLAVPWDADTALFTAACASYNGGNPLMSADLVESLLEYDPDAAYPSTGETYTTMGSAALGPSYAAGWALLMPVSGAPVGTNPPGLVIPEDDVLELLVVTEGAGGTTGRTLVKVLYFAATTPAAAVKS